jgi:chromosome segregation ATPase
MKAIVWVVLGTLAMLSGGCAWKSEVHHAENQTRQVERELAEARKTRDQYRLELERVQGQVGEEGGRTKQLQEQIAKFQVDLKKAREEAMAAQAQAGSLSTELTSAKSATQQALKSSDDKAVAYQRQISDLNDQLTRAKADVAKAAQERSDAEKRAATDVDRAKAEAAAANRRAAELEKQVAELKKQANQPPPGGQK